MQDSPRNRKLGEEAEPSEGPTPSSRRRQWQDVLNEQLRALYETYRADEVPSELLDLAARIEEAQRQPRGGGPSGSGSREEGQEPQHKK